MLKQIFFGVIYFYWEIRYISIENTFFFSSLLYLYCLSNQRYHKKMSEHVNRWYYIWNYLSEGRKYRTNIFIFYIYFILFYFNKFLTQPNNKNDHISFDISPLFLFLLLSFIFYQTGSWIKYDYKRKIIIMY